MTDGDAMCKDLEIRELCQISELQRGRDCCVSCVMSCVWRENVYGVGGVAGVRACQ
jgi:hypothetical protein